jgi:L-ribulokinase
VGVITGKHVVRETYEALHREYFRLHDLFGRGGDDVMRRLKRIQLAAARAALTR